MKKSKKTFFKGNSKGKRAFLGKFGGPTQKKQMTNKGKKHVKQYITKKVKQNITQSPGYGRHVKQQYLTSTPKQPKFINGEDAITARIRRATS